MADGAGSRRSNSSSPLCSPFERDLFVSPSLYFEPFEHKIVNVNFRTCKKNSLAGPPYGGGTKIVNISSDILYENL